MIYRYELIKEKEVVAFFRDLTDVFGEVASLRMTKIRDSVLKSRRYIEAITEIFYDSLSFYLRKHANERGRQKITFLAHNGKTVSVLISANTGLYGDVLTKTFAKFSQDFRQNSSEVTIIGKLGKLIFEGNYPHQPYTYFDFPDFGEDRQKFRDIINHLVQYDEVKIYYTQYMTVLNQKPVVTSLTAGQSLVKKASERTDDFIFEPSVEDILMFFEKEVFATFFAQLVKESQLSKLAGRIMAMDQVVENAKRKLFGLNIKLMLAKHKEINKKQLDMLPAIIFS